MRCPKICLNSYNIVLSNEQQQTAAQLSEVQNSVNVLKADVNELQDRSRVLAMVEEEWHQHQSGKHLRRRRR